MAAQAATSANAKHSSIVSDIRVIEFIYRAIQNAAHNANNMERKKKLPYYVSQIGSMSRSDEPRFMYIDYDKSPLYYDIDDITIIGGAVLNIYDSKLTGFKERRKDEFKSLREELNRETTDIDIVWWPREILKNRGYIYTADSPAIVSFIQSFIVSLYDTLGAFPRGIISGFNNEVKIEYYPTNNSKEIERYTKNILRGVHSIKIIFIINNKKYNIVDLSIHDNGGSQENDSLGQIIDGLVSMYDDPVYCSSIFGNEYSTISFRKTKPYVPHPKWYVKQQLFAYGNFRMRGNIKKMNIIQKRIEYLIKILRSYLRSHTNQNKRNINELFGAKVIYEQVVEEIIALAKEKGMNIEEKEEISENIVSSKNKNTNIEEKEVISENNNENIENNIRKLAEKSTKILEQHANNDRVKNIAVYSKKILESTNTGEVNKYLYFLEELTNMDPTSIYAIIKKYINIMIVFSNLKKGLDQFKTNSAFMIKEKYNDIYNHYAILGSYYIDELDKDPTNEKYKLELNKITMNLENEIVSIQNDINVLQKSASSANSASSAHAKPSRRRGRRGKGKKTIKNKSNQNQ